MSDDWGAPSQPQTAGGDEHKPPVTDPAAAWAALADSFPGWTLDPPLMLEPRRPSA
jgi:hypothetical protein